MVVANQDERSIIIRRMGELEAYECRCAIYSSLDIHTPTRYYKRLQVQIKNLQITFNSVEASSRRQLAHSPRQSSAPRSQSVPS